MAKERSPAKARAALDTVFAAARLDLAALAQKHVFNASNPLGSLKDVLSPLSPNALLQTPLAEHILNFTMMEGTALASLLPDHLGPLPLNRTYRQARALPDSTLERGARDLQRGAVTWQPRSMLRTTPGLQQDCILQPLYRRMPRPTELSTTARKPFTCDAVEARVTGAQNVNLGAALAATGLTYAPCYVSSNPVGAFAGATGLCGPAPARPACCS